MPYRDATCIYTVVHARTAATRSRSTNLASWSELPSTAGAATAVLRGPAMDGATGAWVSLTRPSAFSQLPEEFYTSDFVAPL